MQITAIDDEIGVRQPTVAKNQQLGREFFRSATWKGEGVDVTGTSGTTTVSVTVIAFVSGIRARKYPDGSIKFLDQVTRFDVLRRDEYVQPVERAVFLWERERLVDGEIVKDEDIEYSNEIGVIYSATLEDAEQQCRIFIENLDFEQNFNPAASW